MPPLKDIRLVSVMDRLTQLVTLLVALIVPLGFSGLTYRNLVDHAETQAQVKAGAMTNLISSAPGLWTYQIQRMEAVLARYPTMLATASNVGDAASVYDANGVFLAGVGNPPAPPLLRSSHALYDSGRVVGRVEVVHSLRGWLVDSALAALLGLLAGGTLYGVFRAGPLRQLQRMSVARDAEQAVLQASEARFRSIWESSIDGMRLCDASGKVVSVNLAYCSMVGKAASELQGKFLTAAYSPDDGERILQNYRSKVAARTIEEHFERELVLWQGNRCWFAVSNTYVNWPDDANLVLSIFRDVTDRKHAESDLRTLSRATEQSPASIVITDRIGIIEYVNPRFEQVTGYSKAEAIGTNPRILKSGKTPPAVYQQLWATITTGGEWRGELCNRRKNGELYWEFAAISGVKNEDGEIEHFLAVKEDISERKQADMALQESETRYRTLIEWTPEPFFVHRDGKMIYLNPAATRLFGAASPEVLIGQPFEARIHPDFRQLVITRVKSIVEQGSRVPLAEMKFLRLDGTAIDVEVQGTAITYDGAPAVQAVLRDITARKQAEAARAALEVQLREVQKMEAIGTLAGGIAHDFNNALATILGNAELTRQDLGNTNPAARESLDEIRKAGLRARALVQQILDFSRRQPADRRLLALAPVVEEAVRLLRATLPARLALEVHCDTGVPPVRANATQIQQVLLNLGTNAMQAIPDRPGRIGIRLDTVELEAPLRAAHPALRALHARHPGRCVRLAVSDDGQGMDAATLERMFEPFFTTRAVDEGTGLGLSVVHGIVQSHDGAIVVESQPGRGSIFTIYLPATEAAEVASDPPAAPVVTLPADGRGRHILYLDDEESLVFLVKRVLERRGFRLSGHTDQREALAALRADPAAFDLVVTDYNMPGMSGLDVARAVRAIRADLPVAIASGFIDETLQAQAQDAGVKELIFKASAVEDMCEAFARLAQKAAPGANNG